MLTAVCADHTATRANDPSHVPPVPLFAGLTVVLLVIVRNAWVSEDAYITFRTIHNFVNGDGLRWNVDERVQAYTHPLWMLVVAGVYRFTGEPYFSSIALSIACSLAAIWIVMRHIITDRLLALPLFVTLIFSKAFIDYSTSGLENALLFALLALFYALYFRSRHCGWLTAVAALVGMTRIDAILLVLPSLASAIRRDRDPHRWLHVAAGLLPLASWEAFSIVYYGFPFPNTAYAKLATGVRGSALAMQGVRYLVDSLRNDTITLTATAVVGVLCVARRELALHPLSIGIALYVAYVVLVGGDFMSGRFLAAPFFCAMIAASRLDAVIDRRSAALASVASAALGLLVPVPTIVSGADPPRAWVEPSGIADERRYYYHLTGLLRLPADGPWPVIPPPPVRDGDGVVHAFVSSNIGISGFGAGSAHIIDDLALADALLARLPAKPDWRIGHYQRNIPEGYRETVDAGINHIKDPEIAALYDELWRVTAGPIWSWDRWRAIVRLNLGHRPTGADRIRSPLPTLKADFQVTPSPCTISGVAATVDCFVDGSRSDSIQPITAYSWAYAGVVEADNARLNLRLSCSNTSADRTALVPVTLTVVNAAGTRDTITKSVTITKRNACGFVE